MLAFSLLINAWHLCFQVDDRCMARLRHVQVVKFEHSARNILSKACFERTIFVSMHVVQGN